MDIIRVDNAYVRGGEAFVAGLPREACPFAEDASDRQEWLDGWDEAKQHEIDNRDPPKP